MTRGVHRAVGAQQVHRLGKLKGSKCASPLPSCSQRCPLLGALHQMPCCPAWPPQVELKGMADRILSMRQQLYDALQEGEQGGWQRGSAPRGFSFCCLPFGPQRCVPSVARLGVVRCLQGQEVLPQPTSVFTPACPPPPAVGAPGDWSHILKQIGMFRCGLLPVRCWCAASKCNRVPVRYAVSPELEALGSTRAGTGPVQPMSLTPAALTPSLRSSPPTAAIPASQRWALPPKAT